MGSRANNVVIGAGLGGLAAALRLRAAGDDVQLLERNDQPGGRAGVFEDGGYRFDLGPTVITAPQLLEELFELFGERLEDAVEMRPLQPWYRFVGTDGFELDYGADQARMLEDIAAISPPDRAGFERLIETSRRIYRVAFEQMVDRPFDNPMTMLRSAPAMAKLGSFRSVYRTVSRHLQHPKLREAFSLQPLLIGGSPLRTTSIYLLIHALEQDFGIHYAMGGMNRMVQALASLFERQGGTLRLGADVRKIKLDGRRATGVELSDGEGIAADRVISNGDPAYVYQRLLPPGMSRRWTPRRLRRLNYSMGLFLLYFGTRGQYPDLAHHTILLGSDYTRTLREVFDRKVLPEHICCYLHRPSATDPSVAPPGHDAFYALAPVPNLQGRIDWASEAAPFRDRLLALLEAHLLPGLSSRIERVHIRTPVDFANDYLAAHGSGFSVAPTLMQSAYFRFHTRSEDFGNLYHVGAGVHPGAGIPGVLSSAKVLEKVVDR